MKGSFPKFGFWEMSVRKLIKPRKKWIQILREADLSWERKKEKINFLCRTSGET